MTTETVRSAELNEALAAAQGLVNFYRPLQKLELVLRAAQGAEQLVAERNRQVHEIDEKVAEAKAHLDALTTAAKETVEALEAQKRARVGEIERADADAKAKYAAEKAGHERELAAAQTRGYDDKRLLADEIEQLTVTRDALSQEAGELENLVRDTRAKLSGL